VILEDEVDYRVRCCLWLFAGKVGFVELEALVKFLVDVTIHLSCVVPFDGRPSKIQPTQGIEFLFGYLPFDRLSIVSASGFQPFWALRCAFLVQGYERDHIFDQLGISKLTISRSPSYPS